MASILAAAIEIFYPANLIDLINFSSMSTFLNKKSFHNIGCYGF